MSKVKVNGIELHFQVYGEGETIVFAHGAGGNLLSWWQQIPFFSEHYTCITFDHRGFGRSIDAPDGPGSSAFVDDLAGILDHLEVESAHLVAQSMGGLTALGFAVAYPERTKSLTMADTSGGIAEPDLREMQRKWLDHYSSEEDLAVRAISSDFRTRRPDMAMLYRQINYTNPPRETLIPGDQRMYDKAPMAKDLSRMKIPTLFLVGEDDQITPPHIIEKAASYIPGARFVRVPKTGHSVYFEKPDIFNFEVNRFLEAAHGYF